MKTYATSCFIAKNCLIIFFCLTMFHYSVLAQNSVLAQRQVIGRALDKDTKKPIKEAKITIQGSDSSTVTNAAGFFQITADTTTYLLISCSGYESGSIKVPQGESFQLLLSKKQVADDVGELAPFYMFVQRNLRYPEQARRSKIEGRVYVSFEMDSLGKMQHISLLKDAGGTCGKEVLRVLKACPKRIIPLSARGKFILPVTFKIKGIEQESGEQEIDLPEGKLLNEVVVVSYMP